MVGLTIYKSESLFILNCLKQYLNTENNLAIYIKCHPANIIDIKSYFYNCKNIKVYDDFIFDKEFKFAITGMSTISYELLTFGIPIIVCNESRNFNFLPDLSKIDKKYWQICSNQKEFNSSVNYFSYKYFSNPKEKHKLSSFVKSNYFHYQSLDKIETLYN